MIAATIDDELTATDLFCGAGGSMSGLAAAGFKLVLGANHSPRAIETASANFRDTDFLCTDINHYDMRRLPRSRVLWASVICTELSPAGGNKVHRGQRSFEEFGHVSSDLYERTRACALDVIRATEVHRYEAVIVENVVEFARNWELYDWWVEGMCKLSWKGKSPGYNVQVVNADAAHVYDETNAPAPQWRGRIFIVFTRCDIPVPDLELRPPSWCARCDGLVDGIQTFKRADRRQVGKYGQQYLYRCPTDSSIVEPLVLPAISAIDLHDLGERIGDRKKPLKPNTMARISWGWQEFVQPVIAQVAGHTFEREGYHRAWPALEAPLQTRQGTGVDSVTFPPLMVNSNHDDHRVYPADAAPLPTRTQKIGDGIATPVFYVKNYGSEAEAKYRAHPISDPVGSITSHDSHGLVSTPFVVVNRNHNRPRSIDEPLAPVTTGNNQALVQPFITMLRNHGEATGVADEPVATVTTSGRHHYLTTPPGAFYVKNFGGNLRPEHSARPLTEPFGSITTKDHHALVIPYRKGSRPRRAIDAPLATVSTRESAGLLSPDLSIEDCYYRMLKPREHLRAQRFTDDYIVTGNIGEQTMQAGNAVPCNVAQWIGTRVREVLA